MMSADQQECLVQKTPEWLEVLENKRKRPHKLAHDIGAGSPCLVCKDGCKGLNLHFWRKLCIECKCRKEDHEIQEDEDYAQFEILFGAKKVKRTTLKFNAQSKSFDWIPPNVAIDLAVDYLKSIPESKLPISNSEGARYRKQQLEKQVPLHDVDPNACSHLSDKEMKEFQKYLDNLRDNVIGQGQILKYQSPEMLKENYIRGTPSSMIATSDDYGNAKLQGAEIIAQLNYEKIPESKVFSESTHREAYPADVKYFKHSQQFNSAGNDSQPEWALRKNEGKNFSSQNLPSKWFGPKPFHSFSQSAAEYSPGKGLEGNQKEIRSNSGLKTPSSFLNKGIPVQDKQNNNTQKDSNHNIDFQAVTKEEGSSLPLSGEKDTSLQNPYNASICKEPLDGFSHLSVSSDEVPFIPLQETGKIIVPNKSVSDRSLQPVAKEESKVLTDNTFPTPPVTCQQCLEILNPEEVVVQTERGGDSALWHAKCFVCETCKELLVDLMYFYHKGKVYCGRHFAEILKIPRCHGCDELIFVKEYTIAEGQSYHVRHFCCFHCDEPLGGKQYIPKDNFPVCLDCYQIKYGKNCRTCRLPIAAGEQRVSWQDLDFHVSSQCFRCTQCLKSLLGGKFVVKNANIFCSKDCVQIFFG